MTIADWLINAMTKLHDAGVDSPRRDSLVLLEDTLRKDRAWVVTHPEYEIPSDNLKEVNKLIKRRVQREPLAYIRGRAWFYGRFFNVNRDVMIPRPESESFITLLKQTTDGYVKGSTFHIIDVGTGSGCLAITAKLEIPGAEVIAIDNSQKALDIAKKNARNHKVKIDFLNGDLLQPLLHSSFSVPRSTLMANLPYVPAGLVTSPEITQEPAAALFSGQDGLNHYRQFFEQIAKNSQFIRSMSVEYILTESLENQHGDVTQLAKAAGYKLEKTEVLVQLFKATRT